MSSIKYIQILLGIVTIFLTYKWINVLNHETMVQNKDSVCANPPFLYTGNLSTISDGSYYKWNLVSSEIKGLEFPLRSISYNADVNMNFENELIMRTYQDFADVHFSPRFSIFKNRVNYMDCHGDILFYHE